MSVKRIHKSSHQRNHNLLRKSPLMNQQQHLQEVGGLENKLDRSPLVVEEIQSLEDKLRDEEPEDGKKGMK